jgi:Flp pilus assembly protein TadD
MTPALHLPARPAPAILVVLIGLGLTGCALWGAPKTGTSLEKYREYMAERAAAEIEEVDEEDEPSFEDTLAAARRSHRAGDADHAIRLYFDAFRLDPTDSRSHAGIAYLQLAREPDHAEEVFLKVIEADPNSIMAYVGLGLARLADAQEHALRAAELAPKNSAIVNNYGIANLRVGDAVLAEEAFRNAISLESKDSAYRNNLGIALGRQGRYEEAMSEFLSAGSNQAAENNLGYVYYMNGRLDDAVAHYELALQAQGDDKLKILRNLSAALDAKRAAEGAPQD